MSRPRRDLQAEGTAVQAAADRLLAGTPLRSTTGKLTATELVIESGLRRDVVYASHKGAVETFQARAKARNFTPVAAQQLADETTRLGEQLAKVKAELADERAAGSVLRRMVAELSLELDQARRELTAASAVTRLPVRGGRDGSQSG
jgi:hypothetical protein